MKETNPKEEIVIENVKRADIEKKFELIGQIKPKPNHILFEINLAEKTIQRAEFESIEIDFVKAKDKDYSKNKRVLVKKDCFYISALNEKNCRKVLKNTFGVEL